MFTHLFKLIWNKKKQNSLLIIEMFFCFIVMFAVFTLFVHSYKNYKQEMGFEYRNVWSVNFTAPESIQANDSVMMFREALIHTIRSFPQVIDLSYTSSNVPFSANSSNSNVNYKNKKAELTNFYQAEDSYINVLDMHMVEGRWFNKADDGSRYTPVVINRKLKETLFGKESAIGKVLGEDDPGKANADNRFKIFGVVENTKERGSYQAVQNGMFLKMDTNAYKWAGSMLIKVKPGTGAAFESKLFKTMSNAIGSNIEIEHLDKKLVSRNKLMLVPLIIAAVVGGFLIINVALGLFGVLWYNINKRKGEIGLRRAVGASGGAVSKQLVSEALVLSTLSLIIGCFFAVQFPLMNVFDLSANTYLVAIALSVFFIYMLVIICAIYPGKQAANIYPAVALHEE